MSKGTSSSPPLDNKFLTLSLVTQIMPLRSGCHVRDQMTVDIDCGLALYRQYFLKTEIIELIFQMERLVKGRIESVDMFTDSGDNLNKDEEDMFGEEDDLELIEALEHTNDFNPALDEEVNDSNVRLASYSP